MDRHLISLAVAILLVSVGPGTMVDAALTPDEIEDRLEPYAGNTSYIPVYTLNGTNITNSTCWGRGDVRYHTFDARDFRYNSPIHLLGVMVMPWAHLPWWVVTTQEFFNGGPKTRINEVYVNCAGEFFRADLGPAVTLWHWVVPWGWVPFVFPAPAGIVIGPGLNGGFTIDCPGVPMTVDVFLHCVQIHMTPLHSINMFRVRGICGDYNGYPQNDYINLQPPILPSWKPLLA